MPQGDKLKLVPHINYLEKELQFLPKYKNEVDWKVYQSVREKRLEIERWVECLINATLDISKMFLTINGEEIPETSREILFKIASRIYDKEAEAETFSGLAKIRNTLAHRYLDIRWQDIKTFLQSASEVYPPFLEYVKRKIEI
ncbi:MAG: DUF86 domain-containing protein [Candidatus Brocadia sp.]